MNASIRRWEKRRSQEKITSVKKGGYHNIARRVKRSDDVDRASILDCCVYKQCLPLSRWYSIHTHSVIPHSCGKKRGCTLSLMHISSLGSGGCRQNNGVSFLFEQELRLFLLPREISRFKVATRRLCELRGKMGEWRTRRKTAGSEGETNEVNPWERRRRKCCTTVVWGRYSVHCESHGRNAGFARGLFDGVGEWRKAGTTVWGVYTVLIRL